jgi:hypothetical protein
MTEGRLDASKSGPNPSPPSRPRAFLIAPLSAATAQEDKATYLTVRDALDAAAIEAGVDLIASDDFEPGIVVEQIKREIASASVVIAVCTGRNPNVFYELGLAETRGYLPILVARSEAHLPFDWKHWRCIMYEDERALSTLAQRVAKSIKAALAAQTQTPPDRPGTAERVSEAKGLLLSHDERGYRLALKESIRGALANLDAAAIEHWDEPNDAGYNALAPARHDSASAVLRLLTPVVSIAPERLADACRLVTDEGAVKLRNPGHGRSPWEHIRFAWQYLVLRTLVAAALIDREPAALGTLLQSLKAPQDSDGYPLMLSDRFTWSESYAGNAWTAFQDFFGLVESERSLLAGLETSERTPVQIASGADVVTGLARCVKEDRDVPIAQRPLPAAGYPHIYPSFTHFDPWESVWAARLVSSDDDFARALGVDSAAILTDVAQRWFPLLAKRGDKTERFLMLRWEEYLGYAQ